MRFDTASRTNVGLKRTINEDSILVETDRGLWAVADGMGGHEAGEIASTMVTDALRCLPELADVDELAEKAVEALKDVNRQLIELATAGGTKQTIGTTIVGLAVTDGTFRCFWMGDSRAYLLRDGEIGRLTHDHSLVQNLVDAGMLNPDDAETHENANLITRAVGVSEECDVDIVSGEVRPGDQFVLASDGLTRVVRDQELAEELQRGSPDEVADRLIDTVLSRGAPDNVSVIITRIL